MYPAQRLIFQLPFHKFLYQKQKKMIVIHTCMYIYICMYIQENVIYLPATANIRFTGSSSQSNSFFGISCLIIAVLMRSFVL